MFYAEVWIYLIPFLTKADYTRLRLVCKSFRQNLDEHLRTQRDLKRFIAKSDDPRYLIRSLYVPTVLRKSLVHEKKPIIIRPEYPQPTEWTISTMTMMSYLSTPVDTRSVFHCVDVIDFVDVQGEQCNDLQRAKAETNCTAPITKQGGPNAQCIANECGCLSAFCPGILDIQFLNFCRGNPEFAEVKANKRGRPSVRTFENQCTMRICMNRALIGHQQKNGQVWNIVNLKMFANGKIQMTGCKSLEQARGAVNFLLRKLMEKAPQMRAKRDCMTQLRCFGLDSNDLPLAVLQQIRTSLLLVGATAAGDGAPGNRDVLLLVLLRVDNESLFACRRVNRLFRDITESEQFWKLKSEQELRCTIERHPERATWFMTTKFNGRFHRMERVRNADHFAHPRLLYIRNSARGLRRHKPFLVVEQYEELYVAGEQIVLINSDFHTRFEINLPVLFKILLYEYGKQKNSQIVGCAYSPDDYAALNVKYDCRVPLQVYEGVDTGPVPPTTTTSTIISFFIFRTGSVIINSARSIEQETDAYNFINGVMRDNYARIWHMDTAKPKKRNRH